MRKYLGPLMVAVLVIALLAGCAPAAAPAAPAAPAKPATPAAPAAPATPAAPAQPAAKAKTIIRLVDTNVGSTGWVWFGALALLAEKYSSWLKMEVVPTKGHAEALMLLLQGKGEVAVTAPFLVEKAGKGIDEFKQIGARKDTKLVFNQAEVMFSAIVLDKSPIKAWTAADLKGKKVFTREVGTQGALVCWGYLKAAGLDPEKDVRILYGNAQDGVAALSDGTADIFATMAGQPYPLYEELFASKPSRFIPLPKELTAKTNQALGASVVAPTTLAANSYKGQREPVLSSSNPAVTMVLDSAKEDTVYEITRLWWQYMDERSELHSSIALNGGRVQLDAIAQVGIPFHPGALKYYREKGWMK